MRISIQFVTCPFCVTTIIDVLQIGSISKKDLKSFIGWAEKEFKLPILQEFLTAVPTAEVLAYIITSIGALADSERTVGANYKRLCPKRRERHGEEDSRPDIEIAAYSEDSTNILRASRTTS